MPRAVVAGLVPAHGSALIACAILVTPLARVMLVTPVRSIEATACHRVRSEHRSKACIAVVRSRTGGPRPYSRCCTTVTCGDIRTAGALTVPPSRRDDRNGEDGQTACDQAAGK
jgi:hypothetical protein